MTLEPGMTLEPALSLHRDAGVLETAAPQHAREFERVLRAPRRQQPGRGLSRASADAESSRPDKPG